MSTRRTSGIRSGHPVKTMKPRFGVGATKGLGSQPLWMSATRRHISDTICRADDGDPEARRYLVEMAIAQLAAGAVWDLALRAYTIRELEKHLAGLPLASQRPRKDDEHLKIAIAAARAMKFYGLTQDQACKEVAKVWRMKAETVRRILERNREAAYKAIGATSLRRGTRGARTVSTAR